MAGGGLVQIAGGNKRVKDGVASVINRCLQVTVCGGSIVVSGEVTIAGMENTTTEVLSGSTKGEPIVVPTGPDATIHAVPADATDRITLFCSNPGLTDDELFLRWGTTGADLKFFCPSNETVPLVVEMPLTDGEVVVANSGDHSLHIFGRVDRVVP